MTPDPLRSGLIPDISPVSAQNIAAVLVTPYGRPSSKPSSGAASAGEKTPPAQGQAQGVSDPAAHSPLVAESQSSESGDAPVPQTSGDSGTAGSGSAWPLGLLVGLVGGAGALAGTRKVLSWGQNETASSDAGLAWSEGPSVASSYQPFLQVAAEKYQREIKVAQQTREQDLAQAKRDYEHQADRYEDRIAKDTLRSQGAARRAQQDAYELSQKPQQLAQNQAKLRDDTEFLRQVQEKLKQDEEELQQEQEKFQPLADEYDALLQEYRRWANGDPYEPERPEAAALQEEMRQIEEEIEALADADAEESLELQEEMQSLRESESFLEEEMGDLQEAIDDYPEDVAALEDDIQACQDEQAVADADIEEQQANLEDAESEYEESVAEADEQYEENEADAQRGYQAAEAAALGSADTGQSGDTSGNTGNDQSTGDNSQQGTNPSFDGLDKAFDQALQNALDGTVAPEAIDQALQDAFDKALQEAPPTGADDPYRGLAASLLDALTAQGSDADATSEPSESDGKPSFWDDIVKGISETLDDWDRWFGWRDKRDALWQAAKDAWDTLANLLPGIGGGLAPSESPVWKGYDSTGRGGIRTSGSGNDKQYYEWDRTHGHIETYDRNGNHIGVTDPITGNLDRSKSVPGRRIGL